VAEPPPELDRHRDEVALPGGTTLLVRPIRPADSAALVAMHSRLSADTIYRRYFGARPHLAPADVDRFTRVDGRSRFALVGLYHGALVAVARYEGRPDSSSAELAVIVDDVLQHQGVGRLMLGRLADVATEAGMRHLVADVLAGNAAMLGLLRTLGLPLRTQRDSGTVTVTLDLDAGQLPPERQERARAHLEHADAIRTARP
jgi:GNAT superfamily N-acetyltransferase